MSRTDDYKNLLKRLLPQGRAWIVEQDSFLSELLDGIAVELARVSESQDRLLVETDPRTTFDLLTDWERICGLPDTCTGLAVTLQGRRNQVVARLLTGGTLNKQFFVNLAISLGYEITVDDIAEFDLFKVGISAVGDALYGPDWAFAFSITAPLHTIRQFRVGANNAGDRLVEFGDDVLECVINDHKPAHSVVLFIYE